VVDKMVTGSILSLVLFLTMITVTLGLITFNMQGSVATSCQERYNATEDPANDTITQYNDCVAEGFPNWYYVIFLIPFGSAIALGVKKLVLV